MDFSPDQEGRRLGGRVVLHVHPDTSALQEVIIQTDIFGLYKNTKLLAEGFGAAGYLAVVPDLLGGDAVQIVDVDVGRFDLRQWLCHHTPERIDPIMSLVFRHLR